MSSTLLKPPLAETVLASWLLPEFAALDDGPALPEFLTLPADPFAWLLRQFPLAFLDEHGAPLPLAFYQRALWEWVFALRPGVRPAPFLAVWPRAGGKSTTVELACIVMERFKLRRYGLYISSTQEQADEHVGTNIAALFEDARIDRMVSKHGHSRGWRRNRVRTESGFTIDALGLDSAARGIKLEHTRPDFMAFDDLDEDRDTAKAVQHKIISLTRKLLPAGSADLAVVGVQNLVHDQGIFARLVDGRADFLTDRILSGPYPALKNLAFHGTGKDAVLTGGEPLWDGLSLARCQSMVQLMGLEAFLAECQHEKTRLQGTMLGDIWAESCHAVPPFDVPRTWRIRRAFDWGSSHPFSVGWWAQSDGETPGPHGRVYPRGTRFRIMEYYGWNGKPNEGLRLTNTEIARNIKAIEATAPWGNRVQVGPADTQIFDVVNGRSIADEMATCGIGWIPATKGPGSRRQGAQLIRQLLKASTQWPMEEPGLFVVETCRQWLRTVPTIPRDILNQDDVDSSSEDHSWDETRYECLTPEPAVPKRAGAWGR